MPIIIVDRYTENDAKNNPSVLYIFGDNLKRVGRGGQAAAMRDQPNAIGIATLHAPGVCFGDKDYNVVAPTIVKDYLKAFEAIANGAIVVWPADGIGTGFANLQKASPKIWELVELLRGHLFEFARHTISHTISVKAYDIWSEVIQLHAKLQLLTVLQSKENLAVRMKGSKKEQVNTKALKKING
jgi:hypothetical protein